MQWVQRLVEGCRSMGLSQLVIFNTLCCGIGWGLGKNLVWFHAHPGVAAGAWRNLCHMAWDLYLWHRGG
jgi:hypothetical protein